jgi:hypothetical protein
VSVSAEDHIDPRPAVTLDMLRLVSQQKSKILVFFRADLINHIR